MSAEIGSPPPGAHPKIQALYQYWRTAAPQPGLLPGRKHIDPIEIPKLLENVWLLDIVGDPPRFRFRLIGGALRRIGILTAPGQHVDEVADTATEPVRQMHLAVTEQRPIWFRSAAIAPHHTQMFTLERIYLPLAADGRRVDMLLCLTVFYAPDGREI